MKSIYRVVYSDIKHRYIITYNTDFRKFDRALRVAMRLHKQGRNITIVELREEGIVAKWEYEAGRDCLIFDCDDELTKKVVFA